METKIIEKMLSEVMTGASVLSLKLAGPELQLFFTGGRLENSSFFSIDTDAWIFVVDKAEEIDFSEIKDEEFFKKRPSVMVSLYELTGYDVDSVMLEDNGFLRLEIGGKFVLFCPVDNSRPKYVEKDAWSVITIDKNGTQHGFVTYDCSDFYVNEKNPLMVELKNKI